MYIYIYIYIYIYTYIEVRRGSARITVGCNPLAQGIVISFLSKAHARASHFRKSFQGEGGGGGGGHTVTCGAQVRAE